jgi:hypothetical protein
VPVAFAILYLCLLGIPDQSQEAARLMLGWSAWLVIWVFYAWFIFCGYFGFALAGLAAQAMDRASLFPAGGATRSQRFILALLLAAPIMAVVLALDPLGLWREWHRGYGILGLYSAIFVVAFLLALAPFAVLLFGWGPRNIKSADLIGWLRSEHAAPGVAGAALMVLVLLMPARLFGWDIPVLLLVTLWTASLLLLPLSWRRRPGHGSPIWPAFLLLILLVLSWFEWNENHVVKHRAVELEQRAHRADGEVGNAFERWLEARNTDRVKFEESSKRYPVFLVAAEGGGARAAYFTAAALELLRTSCPQMLRHTFMMVGVSGGSVGAALVAADALSPAKPKAGGVPALPSGCLRDVVDRDELEKSSRVLRALQIDLLSPLVHGLLLPDMLARFVPGVVLPSGWDDLTDRTRYLESALDRSWRAQSGSGLDDLWFREAWPGPTGNVPALALLTTDVTSGRRVAIAHLAMPGGDDPPKDGCAPPLDEAAPDAARARLLTLAEIAPRVDVPLSTAAILSARFPLITSAGALPCQGERRRLVDGGYFENSGLTTILDVIDVLGPLATEKRVALIVLRIENGGASTNARTVIGAKPAAPDNWLPEIASPVRAMLATRGARAEVAAATLSGRASAATACRGVDSCLDLRVIRLRLRPSCTYVPLGWSLSSRARAEMRRQLLGQTDDQCPEESKMELSANRRSLDEVVALLSP